MQILVSGRMPPEWIERFRGIHDVAYCAWSEDSPLMPRAELIARLSDRQVLITEQDVVDAEVMDGAPDLAVIIGTRAAPANIDVAAATERGVVVLNTPGRNADAVGDLTVMMMIMVARDVWPAMLSFHRDEWTTVGLLGNYLAHQGVELPGKTVGLVGFGATGRAVARRLSGFGVRLMVHDPFISLKAARAMGAASVDLDTLLMESDFVSMHVALGPATRGMIGARELALMKPTAFFVNSARAALVDHDALYAALASRRIAAAALDVFHEEPLPASDPLVQLPNVVPIPHLGGASREVPAHQSRIAFEALGALIAGAPINVVNPAAVSAARLRLGLRG